MEDLLFDISWVVPLRTDALTALFKGLTALGYIGFIMMFLPLGYWLIDKRIFTRIAMLVMFTALVNTLLKDLMMDPRPDAVFGLDGRVGTSYGRPSGHAQVAAVMWLWLAWELRRTWIWLVCGALCLGVCMSRIYLGVHDLDDVLVGLGLGGATLLAFGWLRSEAGERWRRLGLRGHLIVMALGAVPIFAAWPGTAPSLLYGAPGFAMGWWAGAVMEAERMDYQRPASWGRRIIAFGLGYGIIVAEGWAFGQIAWQPGLVENAARLLNGALLGFYVAFLAPLLFGRLGLVKRELQRSA